MHQHATLEDTVYLWFGANDTAGSGADGASAVYDVREAGATDSAAPVLSGNATLLTHANYPAGCYEVAVAATAVNGFAANKTYAVFVTLAVSSQNPTGFIGSFSLFAIRTLLTGDAYARLGAPAGASVSADVAAVKTDTAAILLDTGTDGVVVAAGAKTGYSLTATTGLGNQTADITGTLTTVTNLTNAPTSGDLTAAMKASVNAEVDTALGDYDGPTYTELLNLVRVLARKDAGLATDLAALLTTLNADLGSGAGAYANTTDSQEALRDRGDAAWITATGFSTLDAAGVRTAVGLAAANLDTQLLPVANLPSGVKKNTALANFEFLMVASSDHYTAKTGATVTATRSLDGAAFGACANAVSEVSNGIYKITLAASDLNADTVTLRFTATDADDRFITILTEP